MTTRWPTAQLAKGGLIALLLAFVFVVRAYTVPCNYYEFGPISTKGWMDVDGKRHLSYSFSSSFTSTMKNLIGSAVASWNARSNITGVVFDYSGSEDSFGADVFVQPEDPPSRACAETGSRKQPSTDSRS